MNKIKNYLTTKWCALLSTILGIMGFAACGEKYENVCLYGEPYATFKAEGAILNEEGNAINGVEVYVKNHYGDTTTTNQDGNFVFDAQIVPDKYLWLMAKDPSGMYESDSAKNTTNFEGGEDWYKGSFETNHNFTLKKKAPNPSDSENKDNNEPSDNANM